MIDRQTIEAYLNSRGLDFFGVVELQVEEDFIRFENWLDKGLHASMSYLTNYLDVRRQPAKLLANAKSCIVFGLYYDKHLEQGEDRTRPQVAKYARIQDYHKFLRREGEHFLQYLSDNVEEDLGGRVVVDTAPVLERALASQTEPLFIGKNTLAIHPRQGSFFLLGEVFLNVAMRPDERTPIDRSLRSAQGGCGTCRRCQVHCPTGALSRDYELDANKCLSYWTIEHRGPIPITYWPYLARYWYGCDICQDVCPYNRRTPGKGTTANVRQWEERDLSEIAMMTQSQYEAWFGGFALTRAKREGLMRNALIAMHVTAAEGLEEAKAFAEQSEFSVLKATVAQMQDT